MGKKDKKDKKKDKKTKGQEAQVAEPKEKDTDAEPEKASKPKAASNSLGKLVNAIEEHISEFQANAHKQANDGTIAAGLRARKATSALSKLFLQFRKASVEFAKK